MQTLIFRDGNSMNHAVKFLSYISQAASRSAHHLSVASVSRLSWGCGCYEINLSGDLLVADVTGC